MDLNQVKFDNHLITPSKIVCIGRNYVEHIQELQNEIPQNMVVFNKPNSAISDKLTSICPNTRYEGEICFLIINNRIDGIGIGLDLTKSDIQQELKQQGLPWERAKSFDKSAVLSEFVKMDGNIDEIVMKLFINGKLTQKATVDMMIYKPHKILKECQEFMSFANGDIIMSGTPKGVGTYKINDHFEGKLYVKDKLVLEVSWRVC